MFGAAYFMPFAISTVLTEFIVFCVVVFFFILQNVVVLLVATQPCTAPKNIGDLSAVNAFFLWNIRSYIESCWYNHYIAVQTFLSTCTIYMHTPCSMLHVRTSEVNNNIIIREKY